jgi:hypothetical protein
MHTPTTHPNNHTYTHFDAPNAIRSLAYNHAVTHSFLGANQAIVVPYSCRACVCSFGCFYSCHPNPLIQQYVGHFLSPLGARFVPVPKRPGEPTRWFAQSLNPITFVIHASVSARLLQNEISGNGPTTCRQTVNRKRATAVSAGSDCQVDRVGCSHTAPYRFIIGTRVEKCACVSKTWLRERSNQYSLHRGVGGHKCVSLRIRPPTPPLRIV